MKLDSTTIVTEKINFPTTSDMFAIEKMGLRKGDIIVDSIRQVEYEWQSDPEEYEDE